MITFTLWFVISLADSARTYTLIVDNKNTYVTLRTVMRGKSTWFASLRRTWHDKCNISRRRDRIIEARKLLKKNSFALWSPTWKKRRFPVSEFAGQGTIFWSWPSKDMSVSHSNYSLFFFFPYSQISLVLPLLIFLFFLSFFFLFFLQHTRVKEAPGAPARSRS